MSQAHQPSVVQQPRHLRTARLAWGVILTAFVCFCALLVSAGYLAWNYYVSAVKIEGGALIVDGLKEREQSATVSCKSRNRAFFQRATTNQELKEGDQCTIATEAGYGKIATIRLFDQSTLDMWPGASVKLESLQTSLWNNRRQTIVLSQQGGYVRYDVRADQPYQQSTYRVLVGDTGSASVEFAPGGSYSIEVKPSERSLQVVGNPPGAATVTDIAVRSGQALIYGSNRVVKLLPGQRVELDSIGMPGLPVPARWELIRDGIFSEYTEEEYNNTTQTDTPALAKSRTWQVYGVPPDQGLQGGFFKLSQGCLPPNTRGDCDPRERRNAAWFLRSGDQTRPFSTGISQTLGVDAKGVDISEYRSLVFSAWVRVLDQSIKDAGAQGTECPITIRFWGKKNSPTDPEEQRVLCVYASADPNAQPVKWPGIDYRQVELFEWYQLQIELRDLKWLLDYRYLRGIEIYANGHDYNSQVTGVSLIGSQIPPVYTDR